MPSRGSLFIRPWVSKQDVLNVIAEVKSVAGDDPKVYFVGDNDFL